ncbi:MAG TPA: SUMF1/EgtB/PvdO family nonheme iron enzyme, partial [Thermotogota bacterium]|nr:SUMF1/EgtB/PvdO family nonheme iron enzyme [Thermotogota bacterium]
YNAGETAYVLASPKSGYRFVKWTKSGADVFTNAHSVYTMPDEDVTLVAHFEAFEEPQGMALVEGRTFQMGDEIGDIKEGVNPRPTHTVTFTYDYWIGKYEVTFGEYDTYCEAKGISKPDDAGWGRGDRPVIYVNWWDSIAYCNWVSDNEGLQRAYDSNGYLLNRYGQITTDVTQVEGYRLPTESEWEYAASGGHSAIPIPPRFKYAGSDQIGEVSWYDGNSGEKTRPVGGKAPNELGICDMSGNVNEWCHDWLGDYTSSNKTNPIGPVVGTVRALRGGSYWHSATRSRVAYRSSSTPDYRWVRIGFRIARTVVPSETTDDTPPVVETPVIALSATTIPESGGGMTVTVNVTAQDGASNLKDAAITLTWNSVASDSRTTGSLTKTVAYSAVKSGMATAAFTVNMLGSDIMLPEGTYSFGVSAVVRDVRVNTSEAKTATAGQNLTVQKLAEHSPTNSVTYFSLSSGEAMIPRMAISPSYILELTRIRD